MNPATKDPLDDTFLDELKEHAGWLPGSLIGVALFTRIVLLDEAAFVETLSSVPMILGALAVMIGVDAAAKGVEKYMKNS